MADGMPDLEWALRAFYRTELGAGVKVWMAETGTEFPQLVIVGRVGGGRENNTPLDRPRISHAVWGERGGRGRKQAVDTTDLLITLLAGIDNDQLGEGVFCYGVYDITARWAPDDTDRENPLPRYIVDASFHVRSA